jgi:hypothetical protein
MKKITAMLFVVMGLSAACGSALANDTTQRASYDATGHSSKTVIAAECTKENYDPEKCNTK